MATTQELFEAHSNKVEVFLHNGILPYKFEFSYFNETFSVVRDPKNPGQIWLVQLKTLVSRLKRNTFVILW